MSNGFSTMRLDGRRAIVTGGASGIGRATAIEMAHLGAEVVVTDIDEAQARELIGSFGLELMPTERVAEVVTRSLADRIPGAQWVVWPGVEPGTYQWNPAVVPPGGS